MQYVLPLSRDVSHEFDISGTVKEALVIKKKKVKTTANWRGMSLSRKTSGVHDKAGIPNGYA